MSNEPQFRAPPIYLQGKNTVIITDEITVYVETPKILWNSLEGYDSKEGKDLTYSGTTEKGMKVTFVFRRAKQ